MAARTIKRTVTFRKPFVLGTFEEVLPAGDYVMETDETLIDGISFPVYRRVATRLCLPAKSGRIHLERTLSVDPAELESALARDRAAAETPTIRH